MRHNRFPSGPSRAALIAASALASVFTISETQAKQLTAFMLSIDEDSKDSDYSSSDKSEDSDLGFDNVDEALRN